MPPVIADASSDARNTTNGTTSSGDGIGSRCRLWIDARAAGSSSHSICGSVATNAGQTAFTRTPSGAMPAANERVSATTPPFAAV